VHNARLLDAEGVDFQNVLVQEIRRDEQNANRLYFSTMTRGDHSTIVLDLEGLSDATVVSLQLEDAAETGSGPPTMRRHQRIPGTDVTLDVGAMANGELLLPMPFDGYQDSISLRHGSAAPLDSEFDYVDNDDPRQGDYYFVRVRQVDESLAWTSPVWVGGSSPQ
jgi:hypothetical protein